MQQFWNHTYPPQPPHSVEVEHRLTVEEMERRAIKKTLNHHGKRITALETKLPSKPQWSPRDYLLSAAGLTMVLAAVAEKIGWTTAVAAFVKIYGLR
jgi:hypothetical protein